MHRYNRIALCLLAFVLAFSLVGCGTAPDSVQNATEKKTEKTEKKAKKDQSANQPGQPKIASVESNPAQTSAANSTVQTSEVTTQSETNKTQTTPAAQPKVTNPAPTQVTNPEPVHTVTISIIGPKDRGTIVGATKVDIKDGDTVMDILLEVANRKNIAVDYQNRYGSVYVEGIDGIYEGDYPGQSGWTYKLNGIMVQKSAGDQNVKDGDQIVWTYVEG